MQHVLHVKTHNSICYGLNPIHVVHLTGLQSLKLPEIIPDRAENFAAIFI